MRNVCYGKWKWCLQCSHRDTIVGRLDGMVVGFDRCRVCHRNEPWVYPSMGRKRSFSIGTWCPYYAEAMVEQLNGGQQTCSDDDAQEAHGMG